MRNSVAETVNKRPDAKTHNEWIQPSKVFHPAKSIFLETDKKPKKKKILKIEK